MIPLYPIFFTAFCIIAIILVYLRFRDNKMSLMSFLLWAFLLLIILLFALDPSLSNILADIFGITRGLDFIIIISILGLLYLSIKLFFRMENLQQDINKLVRELAIRNEIDLDKDDNKKD
ncbi:DUF2304 family protein [Methanobrevibacter sp. DSM 116169]|uniref:DUF2304 family protein n=1 Tax=Methanobrevibacter sp. DSM 116169 TaxID=3242727 RepID=UPI0038FC35BF